MPERKKSESSGGKTISIVALIISIFAIMIAYLPFHFQYVRIKYDIKATILSVLPNYDGYNCIADIIFTNNGNRACSIVDVNIEEQDITTYVLYGGYKTINNHNQSPFTINPGEVLTKQYLFGKGDLKIDHGGYLNNDTISFSISFKMLDLKGQYFKVKEPIFYGVVGGAMTIGKFKTDFSVPNIYPKIIKLLPASDTIKNEFNWPIR